MKKRIDLELIFSMYIMIPLGLLNIFFPGYSSVIFKVFLLILCLIYYKNIFDKRFLFYLLVFSLIMFSDIIFYSENIKLIYKRIIDFYTSVFFPFIFAYNLKKWKKLLDYMLVISILILIATLISIVNENRGDYMNIGIILTIPTLIFICKYQENKRKINLLLSIISSVIIFLFSNRSPFLIIGAYVFFKGSKKIKVLIISSLFLFDFFINRNLNLLIKILKELIKNLQKIWMSDYYAINKIIYGLKVGIEKSSSGRGEIYREAIVFIEKNPFIGNGLSFYQLNNTKGQPYVHNFVLQILLEFGICIFVGYLVLVIYKLIKIYVVKKNIRYFYKEVILIYFVYQIRFLLSGDYWKEPEIFIFIGLMLNQNIEQKRILRKIKEKKCCYL